MTVDELLRATLPRLQGQSNGADILQTVNNVSDLIFTTLVHHQADLACATVEATVLAGEINTQLPDDFRGLADHPWIADQGVLQPANIETFLTYFEQSGQPRFYRLAGDALQVVPLTDGDVAVHVTYWQYPEAVTALSDSLPYGGMFDLFYIDLAVARLLGSDISGVMARLEALLQRRKGGRRRVKACFF